MPIQSSTIIENRAQADGRRSVREQHTDAQGGVHIVAYLAEAAADVNAIMAARVASLDAQLTESEIAANVAQAFGDDL